MLVRRYCRFCFGKEYQSAYHGQPEAVRVGGLRGINIYIVIHSEEILREEHMAPFGLGTNAFVIVLGISATQVHETLHEKHGVSTDITMCLARYFGTGMGVWINLQVQCEVCLLEGEKGQEFMRIIPRRAA